MAGPRLTPNPDDELRRRREEVRDIFLFVLREASIEKAFEKHVEYMRGGFRIAEDLYDLNSFKRVLVIAMGKAAHSMAAALTSQTGSLIQGIVVRPEAAVESTPQAQLEGFRYFFGGHPLPNAESLRAAESILRASASLDEQSLVIYLISGGGSSLVEKGIDAGMGLDDLIATNRVLIYSGAPIAEMNAIRKHLSAVKGGRLALAAGKARQVSIMVSDVPDRGAPAGSGKMPAPPDALASGPTLPDSTTVEDCYRIVERYGIMKDFSPRVQEIFRSRSLEETPKPGNPAFDRSRWWTVLSSANAQHAAAVRAKELGLSVEIDNTCDDWDYARAGDYLLSRLRHLGETSTRACLVSGGEVTVKILGDEGVGGRNQQLALYCAQQITGENICVLSAGTDGIDGNSPAAGAVADGTTIGRCLELGFDPGTARAKFDAYPLFKALGDAIVTGPTGNNVRDLRVLTLEK